MMSNYEDQDDAPPPPPPMMIAETQDPQGVQYEDSQYNEIQEFNDQPPYPWERRYSVEDEAFYYFNPETGECFWEQPKDEEEEGDEDEFMGDEEFEEFLRNHQGELEQLGYGMPRPTATSSATQQPHQDLYSQVQQGNEDLPPSPPEEYAYSMDQQQQQYYDQMQHQAEYEQFQQQQYAQQYDQQNDQQQQFEQGQHYHQQGYDQPHGNEYTPLDDDNISLADLASIEINSTDNRSVYSDMRSVYSNMTDPNLNVVGRSNLTMQAKQQKIEALKRQRELQERATMKQHPTITNKSKQKNRSVEDMLQWEKDRQAKLQAKAYEIEEQQRQEHTGKPMVTKLANILAQKWREGEEDTDGTLGNYDVQSVATSIASKSVQDRLWEYEEKKRMRIQMLQAQQEMEARLNAKPKLISRSVKYNPSYRNNQLIAGSNNSVGDSDSVADRLYALAELRKANPNPMGVLHIGGKPIQHDETTGQRLFEPKINRTSEKLATRARDNNMPIEDWLYMKGLQYQRKVEEKEKRKRQHEQYLRGISKINPNSERLARERYLVYGESTAERLHRPIGAVKPKTLESMNKFDFKPKISEGSLEILQQGGNRYRYFPPEQEESQHSDDMSMIDSIIYGESTGEAICVDGREFSLLPQNKSKPNSSRQSASAISMYQRTLYWEEQRKKRLEQERLEYERTVMKECSFRPKVDPVSKVIQSTNNKGHIADRHANWAKEREDKLALKRQQQALDEIKDCTFVPKVPVPTSSSNAVTSATARVNSNNSNKPSNSGKNTKPAYEEASSLLVNTNFVDKNSTGIIKENKVRFQEDPSIHQYHDTSILSVEDSTYPVQKIALPARSMVPQPTASSKADYSAFDFGDDEYTPKVAQNSRPQIPSANYSQQSHASQSSYIPQQQPQHSAYPSTTNTLYRPTDLQEPDDDLLASPMSTSTTSTWVPPQSYGADFIDLEVKAHHSLRNSFPPASYPPNQGYPHQYAPHQSPPRQLQSATNNPYYPQINYPSSPNNPYNMHYYADPPEMGDDDMSQAVEL